MFKKAISYLVLLAMLSVSIITPPPVLAEEDIVSGTTEEAAVCTEDYVPVCGTDNATYSNECQANAAGYDMSYDGECKDVTDEKNQEEETQDIHFVGMLIEIGSTDVPTTIIVRANGTSTDYTVNIDIDTLLGQKRGQHTKLSNWIPGDQIRVIGTENDNTNEIDAIIVANHSINVSGNRGINGWITKIDKDNKEITYQWANVEHTFKYDDDTRMVSGLKNPASVDDLEINDRIRGRLLFREGEDINTAKIVIVLRRGANLFMKIRTFVPKAKLARLDSTVVPTTIQVEIQKTAGLRVGDVNNLIGTEGTLVTVNITEDTKLVRKFFGRTTLGEFSTGDKLHIVGRVNDDGTVDAKMIKNESIWKTHTKGHAGSVLAVDVANSNITIEWTPITYQPLFKLRKILQEEDEGGEVSAQTLNIEPDSLQPAPAVKLEVTKKFKTLRKNLRKGLLKRIKKVVDKKVGKFTRKVRYKKIKIDRIKHPKVKLKRLIKRRKVKKMRIDITENTRIVVGTDESATISDIQIGDKVRVRGTRHANLPLVVADSIVIVNSLPEIELNEESSIDDINEVVDMISTDDEEDVSSDTEEEIEEEKDEDEELIDDQDTGDNTDDAGNTDTTDDTDNTGTTE